MAEYKLNIPEAAYDLPFAEGWSAGKVNVNFDGGAATAITSQLAFLNGIDPAGDEARQAVLELEQGLTPSLVKQTEQEMEAEALEVKEEAANITLNDPTVDEDTRFLGFQRVLDSMEGRDTFDQRTVEQLEAARYFSDPELQRARTAFPFGGTTSAEQAQAFTAIRDLKSQLAAEGTSSTSEALLEVAGAAIDPTLFNKIQVALRPVLGDVEFTNIGDAVREAKRKLRDAPASERIEMVRQIIDGIKDTELTITDTNGFDRFLLAHTLIDDQFITDSQIESDAFLEQTFAYLDAVSIALIPVGAVRGVRKVASGVRWWSNLGKMTTLHPEVARELAYQMALTRRVSDDALGVTAEENIVTNVLPSAGDVISGTADISAALDRLIKGEDARETVRFVLSNSGRVIEEADRGYGAERVRKASAKEVRRAGGVVHDSKVSALGEAETLSEDTFTIRMMIGADETRGFTPGELMRALRTMEGISDEDVRKITIHVPHGETGELHTISLSDFTKLADELTTTRVALEPLGPTKKGKRQMVRTVTADNRSLLTELQAVINRMGNPNAKRNRGGKANRKQFTKILSSAGFRDSTITRLLDDLEDKGFSGVTDAIHAALAIQSRLVRETVSQTIKRKKEVPVPGTGRKAEVLTKEQAKGFIANEVRNARSAIASGDIQGIKDAAKAFGLNAGGKKADIIARVEKVLDSSEDDLAEAIMAGQEKQFKLGRDAKGNVILDPAIPQERTIKEYDEIVEEIIERHELDFGTLTIDKIEEILVPYMDSTEKLITRPVDPTRAVEFFLGVERQHTYNLRDITKSDYQRVTGWGGKIAKYFPAASQFAKSVVLAGANAERRAAILEKEFRRMLQRYTKLDPTRQSQVSAVLDEGERVGKWYEGRELEAILKGDERMIQAYNGVRDFNDLLYKLNNRRIRRELVAEGYKYMRSGEFERAVRPLKEGEPVPNTVFDPVTGAVIDVRSIDPAAFRDRGYQIVRSKSEIRVGRKGEEDVFDTTHYVLAREALGELPVNVLRYRPGYIARGYDAGYIVQRTVTVYEDGVKKERQIAERTAGNRGEAIRYIQSQPDDGKLDMRPAKEQLDEDYLNGESFDFYNDNSLLFFSARREDELMDVSGKRSILSVGDALERSVNVAARQIGMGEYLNAEKIRWRRTHRRLLEQIEGVNLEEFPRLTAIKDHKFIKATDQHQWRQAIADYERIRMLERHDDSASGKAWNEMMRYLSDVISTPSDGLLARARNRLATGVLLSHSTPADWIKRMTFNALIVANPARQVLLQLNAATVYMGVNGGFSYYMNFGRKGMIYQWNMLGAGLAARELPGWEKTRKVLAKSAGMTEAEYEEFVDQFRRSGLLQTLDSHDFISSFAARDGARTSDAATAVQAGRVRKAVSTPFTVARKVGFEAGETGNLMAAWLTARKRWMNANPGMKITDKDLQDIAGDAGNLALNMNAGDRPAYQKGLFSMALQFFSVQLKTSQVIAAGIPLIRDTGFANRSFTAAEARKVAAFQFALYGLPGIGAWQLYNTYAAGRVPPAPEWANEYIRGGLLEMAFNAGINALFDTDTKLAFSDSMAPLSGPTAVAENIAKFLDLVHGSDASIMEIMAGASWTLGTRIKDFADMGSFVLGQADVPTGDKLVQLLPLLLDSISAGHNNLTKARLAMKLGYIQSNSGQDVVRASLGDAMGKIMGLQSHKEQDVNDLYFELLEDRGGTFGTEAELDAVARDYYTLALKHAKRFADGDIEMQLYKNLMYGQALVLNLAYEPHQRMYIINKMTKSLAGEDLTDNRTTRLNSLIAQGLYQQGWISDMDTLVRRLEAADDWEGKGELLKFLQEFGAPLTEEQLNAVVQD